jgi:hypothetical protein
MISAALVEAALNSSNLAFCASVGLSSLEQFLEPLDAPFGEAGGVRAAHAPVHAPAHHAGAHHHAGTHAPAGAAARSAAGLRVGRGG